MEHFEWKDPLIEEEKAALSDYKDSAYSVINTFLRGNNVANEIQTKVDRLDSAIKKGRCTEAITLYRATGTKYFTTEGDMIKVEPGFLSTTLNHACLGNFFEPEPVLLVIRCPQHTSMAAFENDDAGGEESERLLPRATKLRKISERITINIYDALQEDGPFNHHYIQLKGQVSIRVFIVEPIMSTG